MDPHIKSKIDKLLHELRSWEDDEERYTVQELAEKFDLTVFVVARIAAAEDVDVRQVPLLPEVQEGVDSEAITQPIGDDDDYSN